MRVLLKTLTESLVKEKDKLKIIEKREDNNIKYIIKVTKNDLKTVIGEEGKTIKAIRNLINIAALNKGIKKKIPVEIVEDE